MDIRTLCLGLLYREEATGYEIRKKFEGPLGYIHEPSFGSIYPALNRLARDGLLVQVAGQAGGRPGKKTYRITDKGRAQFRHQLHEQIPGADRLHSDFLLTMLFGSLLSDDFVDAAIARRIEIYRQIADAIDCDYDIATGDPGIALVHDFGLAMCKATVQFLENVQADRRLRDTAGEHATAAEPGVGIRS
ncbi:MAG: PadR family transcriptional regulator [Proteobacteria bacterium]|nr:PadR family transcriptional regulator [Pseudomonadota bacterium]MDA1131706.1 PadR family transcriptional regulator [Pseudomonadota bacterium]